jgi:hypothetical protein
MSLVSVFYRFLDIKSFFLQKCSHPFAPESIVPTSNNGIPLLVQSMIYLLVVRNFLKDLLRYQFLVYSRILRGGVNRYKQFIMFSTYNCIQDIVAFMIYIETHNQRYTVHKDFTWKHKWEKTMERFLIYQKITSTGSTNFQDSPAPT